MPAGREYCNAIDIGHQHHYVTVWRWPKIPQIDRMRLVFCGDSGDFVSQRKTAVEGMMRLFRSHR